jgi:AcrR family transcriptional regulator
MLMKPASDPSASGDQPKQGSERDARGRLVDAAVASFASKGFHGTTTRDIASAAGMSPAALYVHHRSKEELLYLIARSGHEQTLQVVQEAASSSRLPRDQLVAIVDAFTMRHALRHERSRIVSYELRALTPEHFEEIAEIRRATHQVMREVVEAGVAAGEFHTPNTGMTTLALLSLGIDVARWFRDDGGWSAEEISAHYCQLALRIVGARARAR